MAEALGDDNCKIKILILSSNVIGTAGLKALMMAVGSAKSLEVLDCDFQKEAVWKEEVCRSVQGVLLLGHAAVVDDIFRSKRAGFNNISNLCVVDLLNVVSVCVLHESYACIRMLRTSQQERST